jgi:hypothetical protein
MVIPRLFAVTVIGPPEVVQALKPEQVACRPRQDRSERATPRLDHRTRHGRAQWRRSQGSAAERHGEVVARSGRRNFRTVGVKAGGARIGYDRVVNDIDWTGVEPERSPIAPLDARSFVARLRLLSERASSMRTLREAFARQHGPELSRDPGTAPRQPR